MVNPLHKNQTGSSNHKLPSEQHETKPLAENSVKMVRIILKQEDVKQFPKSVQNKISNLNPKFIEYIENYGGFTIGEGGKITQEIALEKLNAKEKALAMKDATHSKYFIYEVSVNPTSRNSSSSQPKVDVAKDNNLVTPPERQNIQFYKDLTKDYSDETLSEINSGMLSLKIKYSQSFGNKRGENDILTLNKLGPIENIITREPSLKNCTSTDLKNFVSEINVEQSEKFLKSTDGSKFLIRPSTTTPDALTLSIKKGQNGDVVHIKLPKGSNDTYIYNKAEYQLLDILKLIKTTTGCDFIDIVGFQAIKLELI